MAHTRQQSETASQYAHTAAAAAVRSGHLDRRGCQHLSLISS